MLAYLNRALTLTLQGREKEAEKDLDHYRRYAGDAKDTIKVLLQEARESHGVPK